MPRTLRTVGFAVGIHNTAELDEPVDSADETGQFDNDCSDSGKADACQPVLDPLQRAEARYSNRDDDLDAGLGDDLNDDLDDACRIATQEFADHILGNTSIIQEWFEPDSPKCLQNSEAPPRARCLALS